MSTEVRPHTMELHCREDADFSGDPFSASNLVIFVMDDNSNIYHCYTREEFNNFLKTELQKNICIQKPNSAQKDESEPVIREPGSQVWLDRSVLAYKDKNLFFVYLRKKNVPLRSEFGVSTFHGTPYDVYSVIPIENKNVLEMDVRVLKNAMKKKINGKKEVLAEQALEILQEKAVNDDITSYIFSLREGENMEEEEEEENMEEENMEEEEEEENMEEEEEEAIEYDMLNDGTQQLTFSTNDNAIQPQIYVNRNITILNCSMCPNLTSIPNIIGLKQLDCSMCPKLASIPNIIGLEKLYCAECPKLTSIPNIIGLKSLDCSACPRLLNIPRIIGATINCSGSPGCR